ncbi:unnamed protein product [Acanthoscelides obtectus]|uniref:DDE Tnp4 domain-containing protein n=1 Tax=Acanthoscelides obtectus TaxID=200917 RepID=A0A9P0KL48_ACAOB|nr:unnamed protein product [Acanthoscelides obtectus]CAK1636059.1 Protein ALP1-like [Acanthoscelides obtectus]
MFLVTPSAALAFATITVIFLRKKKKKSKTRRRWWSRQIFHRRSQYGNRLLRDMTAEPCEDIIRNFTRMTTQDFEHVMSLVEPKIRRMDTNMREAITVKERLTLCLRFLATGDSYTSLQYLFKISKSAILRIIPEVCDALIESLQEYVKVPSTTEEWLQISAEFERKWQFPHTIGAIDGKHVVLQAPINSGTEYYNYKHFFSIVLFALVDADYNFIYADVGCQGRISDGGVFKNTTLYKKLEGRELKIPQPEVLQVPYSIEVPYYILGDKAFALNEYTMKPFDGNPEPRSAERVFNYRLSRARRVVENAFGILSSVFRVLRKSMLLEPKIATKVTLATIYLHNFLRKRTSRATYTPPGSFDTETQNGAIIDGCWRNDGPTTPLMPTRNIPRRSSRHHTNVRLHIANHFIWNDSLPWQENY